MRQEHKPILAVNVLALLAFTLVFLSRKNYEFLIYVAVIIALLLLILYTSKKVEYPTNVLWGLTIWALLHMSGGAFFFGNTRLYEIIVLPLSTTLPVLRYDQVVHVFGFGVATCMMYVLLQRSLLLKKKTAASIAIVTVMAGLGVGALNEILEFIATVVVPQTGVGGYLNTSLDLVADLIGALLAWAWIRMHNS